jgi:hypothetical protein
MRVGQQFRHAVRAQHRGDRDRDGADPHRRQVHGDELGRIGHQHQHPLLGLQADGPQPGRGPAHPVVQLPVGQLAGGPGQRQPRPVPGGQPAVQQVLACIEQLRHGRCSR